MNSFEANLKQGRLAEDRIIRWLRQRGNTVLPAYDVVGGEFKGPRLFTPDRELILPDLLVWKRGRTCWIEAKNKGHFTWHRITGTWQTGIDLHHWYDYLEVWAHFEKAWDVWLMFLHDSTCPSDDDLEWNCPLFCPVGLYGNPIGQLKDIGRVDWRWGNHGMIYWKCEDLRLLADLEDVA